MKISFSTLACPDWDMPRILAMASKAQYDGVELRFVKGEEFLWKLSAFSGSELAATRRAIQGKGLAICCVDTSCHFHWSAREKRQDSVDEGARMAELAAGLGAPGIRVFGDKIQTGADRNATRGWIEEGITALAEKIRGTGIEVWLETHGDFANAGQTATILKDAGRPATGAVWDSANCFIETGERPIDGATKLGAAIRHVHIKDLHRTAAGTWDPILTGSGTFPLTEVLASLRHLRYNRFVSFEWEKKWHPTIPDADIALPQFADWYRRMKAP